MIILFDLDGTLIDSTEAILESFHNSFAVHGFSVPDDAQIKALIGHPLDVMYRELGVDEALVLDFVTTYKEHYREISTQKNKTPAQCQRGRRSGSSICFFGNSDNKNRKIFPDFNGTFRING